MPSTPVFTPSISPLSSTTTVPTTTTTSFGFALSTVSATTAATVTSTTTADALLKLCLLWSVLNKPELQRFGDDPDFPEVPQPPLICNDYLLGPYPGQPGVVSGKIVNGTFFEEVDPDTEIRGPANMTSRRVVHSRIDHKYSSRSFAVIGALAGIVFILLIMALTTCIRHRRELYLAEDPASRERGYAREILINHIRQFRANSGVPERHVASIDPPPSYEDVVKEPPSHDVTSASSASSSSTSVPATDDCSSSDDACGQPPSYFEAVASMTDANVIQSVVTTTADVNIVAPSQSEECSIKRHPEGVTTIHID